MSDPRMNDSLDDLYRLIDDIQVAMLTSVAADGSLVARPMQTQQRDGARDLWFMTSTDTHKVSELRQSPVVNLAYYDGGSRQWVSVSGSVLVSQDRDRIHRLYQKDWKAWLGDAGPGHDGGPDDPRIVLLDVVIQSATYFKTDHSRPVTMLKIAKAVVTGEPPKVGEVRHVDLGTSSPPDSRLT